jgi:phosphoribosylformimino-5-aminoimidazole carboxamide ribotide isomerase
MTLAVNSAIIPVVDFLHGHVVRAVAGQREYYQPVQCPWAESTNLAGVLLGLLERVGNRTAYIADLTAIMAGKSKPSFDLSRLITETLADVWLDCGLTADDLPLATLPEQVRPVVGSESFRMTSNLPKLHDEWRKRRPIISLDLLHGQLLQPATDTPLSAVYYLSKMIDRGYAAVIVLDLAAVGGNRGPSTLELCRFMRRQYPTLELYTGGGIRNRDDVGRLLDVGVNGVLVSSALYSGAMP